MTELLTSLGSVFTFLMAQVSTVFAFIIDNPIALIGLGLGLAFTIVAFARRFISVR